MGKAKKKKETPENTTGTPPLKKPVKYLRELSVVIIGVAVTFLGSDWISNRKSKNDLERYLSAVKTEMQDNLEIIREKAEFYRYTGDFAHYLMSDQPENLSADSLEYLGNRGDYGVFTHIFTLTYKTSAFDMLKSSGTMHLISDNSLFLHIMDSYNQMENVKQESDNYMARKIDVIYGTVMKHRTFAIDLLDPAFREEYFFFAIYIDLDTIFEDCVAQIEETLSLL